MLVSLSWLNDYVDLSELSVEKIAEALTSLGLEVDGTSHVAGLDPKVVVAVIDKTNPHPKADNLQLCTVRCDEHDSPLQIVCGAKNARPGIKVALAGVGAKLADGMIIKPSKIRGESSAGMLCSEKELGISQEDDEITELDPSWTVGTTLSTYFDIEDVILELSITPNRADCLGYIGIARDLAAKLQKPLRIPTPNPECFDASMSTDTSVTVGSTPQAGCSRFVGLYGKGLKALPSPHWMQRRLLASGQRPKNTLIDVTNYVMLETGQPLHAYDRSFISGDKLGVREAVKDERLTALDGTNLTLAPGDLLIHDNEKPVGLAGIMGGANSEVSSETSDVLIEVAHFDPGQIRKTAKRLGLHTEASHRFERGINRCALPDVARRAGALMIDCLRERGHQGGVFAGNLSEYYPAQHKKPRIAMRLRRARKVLAMPHLSLDLCNRHLRALGLELLDKTEERALFEVPPWRHDIVREIDLIEEVGRLEGFDKIPSELPRMNILPNREAPLIGFTEQVQSALAVLGMSEVITYPFKSLSQFENLGLSKGHPLWPSVRLSNPLSEQACYLRTTAVPDLLESVAHNRAYGEKGVRLFLTSRGFFNQSAVAQSEDSPLFSDVGRPASFMSDTAVKQRQGLTERQWVSGILDTPMLSKDWQQAECRPTLYSAKELLATLSKALGVYGLDAAPAQPSELPFLHPGAAATVRHGHVNLGFVGELHPKVARNWDLRGTMPVVFELDCEKLLAATQSQLEISAHGKRFPPVVRDLAYVVDQATSYKMMTDALEGFPSRRYLDQYRLFDLYQGDSIAQDKKSFAFSLKFHSREKTLTDKDVDREVRQLSEWLAKDLDATLRD